MTVQLEKKCFCKFTFDIFQFIIAFLFQWASTWTNIANGNTNCNIGLFLKYLKNNVTDYNQFESFTSILHFPNKLSEFILSGLNMIYWSDSFWGSWFAKRFHAVYKSGLFIGLSSSCYNYRRNKGINRYHTNFSQGFFCTTKIFVKNYTIWWKISVKRSF